MLTGTRARWREWCRTPRPRVLDFPYRMRVVVAVVTGTGWLAFAQGAVAVVTGGADPSGGRGRAAVVYSLVALTIAVVGTFFVRSYLRRPVLPDDRLPPPSGDPNSPEAIAARAEAARRLGSWRMGGRL